MPTRRAKKTGSQIMSAGRKKSPTGRRGNRKGKTRTTPPKKTTGGRKSPVHRKTAAQKAALSRRSPTNRNRKKSPGAGSRKTPVRAARTGVRKSPGTRGARKSPGTRGARGARKTSAATSSGARRSGARRKVGRTKSGKTKEQIEREKREEDEINAQIERNRKHNEAVNARLRKERAEKEAKEKREKEFKEKALTADSKGVLHIPISLLPQALEVAWAAKKTPLVLDESGPKPCRSNTYFKYHSNTRTITAGAIFVEHGIKKMPLKQVLDKHARRPLVGAIKAGSWLVINMAETATDFKQYNSPTEFPAKEVLTHGEALKEEVWDKFVRDSDKNQGFFFTNEDFRVIMLSEFGLEDYADFLKDSIWLDLMMPIEILPAE